MNPRRLLLLGLLLSPLAPLSRAQPPSLQEQTESNRNNLSPRVRNGVIPASLLINELQAVNLARQRFAGNVLRITLVGETTKRRYQIRMENEGKVFTVFVNANTGAVSSGS